MRAHRSIPSLVVAALAAACAVAVATPAAAASPPPATPFAPAAQAAATASLTRAGLTPARAAHRLAAQRANGAAGAAAVKRLGARAVGSYLDPDGNAVVTVLDTAAVGRTEATGVTLRAVRHSTAELAAVKRALDALGPVPNSSWGVDPVRDQVTVTLSDATPPADAARVRAALARAGDLARIETTRGPFETDAFYDGDAIQGSGIRCSAGFNVYSPSDDGYYTITAGHCASKVPEWNIGPTVDAQFPGTDFGLTDNYNVDAQPQVDLYNGTTQPITGSGDPYVGEQFCKSGSTTALSCGTVSELDRTVTYAGGNTVYGLMVSTTASDHGDSGGPAFDGGTGIALVSGGNGNGVHFFQPLQPALDYYGSTAAY